MCELKKDLMSMTLPVLTEEIVEHLGEKTFRAKQIYQWIHVKLVRDFSEMTNLSKELRERLKQNYTLNGCQIVKRQTSKLDSTSKFLMELADGNHVESVWMQYHHGNSVCISSQAGCRMGCRFCASTTGGLIRSLTPAEMLSQIYEIQKMTGERVSNIIIMGMGEPFDNYENVLQFIRMVSDTDGLHISQRNITLSTCGLADKIQQFAEEGLSVTLALSLHAPNDALRREIMPVANRYSVEEIRDACKYYIEKTGRRITFEYSMMRGINDTKVCANQLAELVRGMNCHINLIPLNQVEGRLGSRSDEKDIRNFKIMLEKYRLNVTIRRELGSDIDAACGQLRNKSEGGETT